MKITDLRKTWISGASLAAGLLVSGLSPVEARAIADDHTAAHAEARQVEPSRDAGDVIDDTWITTKVKSSLLADDDVSGLDIAVETRGNVVYLTGHAESEGQMAHAIALAQAVEGVARVDSSALRVEGMRRDASGQARHATGMERDHDDNMGRDMHRDTMAHDSDDDLDDEIAEEANEAGNALDNAGEAVGDAWITTKVKSKLLADSDVSGLDVSVETRDNVVYLSGEAESQAQVTRASQLARETEGVTRVDATALRVATATSQVRGATGMDRDRDHDADDERRGAGEAAGDAWITTKVKSQLLADSDVSGLDVSVETRNNVVYLSGEAETRAQVTRASQLARQTEGVTRVDASALRVATATGQARATTGMDRDRERGADRDMDMAEEEGRYGDDDRDDTDREAGEVIDDAWITTKVKSKLLADGDVSGFDISVETRNNVVYLTGVVETQAQIQEAVRLAAETEGVLRVEAVGLVIGDE